MDLEEKTVAEAADVAGAVEAAGSDATKEDGDSGEWARFLWLGRRQRKGQTQGARWCRALQLARCVTVSPDLSPACQRARPALVCRQPPPLERAHLGPPPHHSPPTTPSATAPSSSSFSL